MMGVMKAQSSSDSHPMGLISSASMGIGAMIGAGIFALLGQVASLAEGLTVWLFIAGAGVTLLSAYSYARLGQRFPSSGGVAEYLVQGYGAGYTAGSLTVMFYLSIVVGMGLVARAFGAYAAALLPSGAHPLWEHVFASCVVIGLTIVNSTGSEMVGRAERNLVAFKLLLLSLFIVGGLAAAGRLGVVGGDEPRVLDGVHAFALCLLAYQGFGVITNTVDDMPDAKRTLPRAMYLAVAVVAVVYTGVAITTLSTLSIDEIVRAQDYALAEAAKPIIGAAGFTVVAVTALLSAASCINASLYSSANMTLLMASVRELPAAEGKRVWRGGTIGLFSTSALVILITNAIDLSQLATLASLVFLLVYSAAHLGHLMRLTSQTGASRGLVLAAFLANGTTFLVFGVSTVWQSGTLAAWLAGLVVLSCLTELVTRRVSGPIRTTADASLVPSPVE